MGCLNSILKMWLDERFIQGEKNTWGMGCEGSGLLAALTTLSSALRHFPALGGGGGGGGGGCLLLLLLLLRHGA